MSWMKTLALASVAAAILAVPTGAAGTKHIIGIFYEGCEKTCEGFKAGIAESGFDADVTVIDMAQDKTRIPATIQDVRAKKPDLVLVYGTTATLGIIGTMDDASNPDFINDIPVVFTAVADPFGSKIAQSFKGTGRSNVAGTFNRVPEKVNVEVLRQYDTKIKMIGLLYNGNEKNSVQKRDEMAKLATDMGFELVAIEIDPGNANVPDPAFIPVRMRELKDKGVKWVYLGSSSFLNKNGAIFTSSAVENGIGVLSPYEALVREQQALLSVSAPREDVGHLAADQALAILRDGKKPGDLPIKRATKFNYVVNMKVADTLGRKPPFAFYQDTELVQ